MRMAWDGDAWGWVQSWRFAIADVLTDDADGCPDEWQFRRGSSRTWREDEPDSFAHLAVFEALGRIGASEVTIVGNMLMSYADELRDADKDY